MIDIQRQFYDISARLERLEKSDVGSISGSFIPTLVGASTPGTFTYGSGTLVEWTLANGRLYFNGRISISATSVAPVGALTIRTWPYAGVADTDMAIAGIAAITWAFVDLPAGYTSIALQFANGSTQAALVRSGDNVNLATLAGGELTGGVYDFRFGGNYRVV